MALCQTPACTEQAPPHRLYHDDLCKQTAQRLRRREKAGAPAFRKATKGYRGDIFQALIDHGIGAEAVAEGRTGVWVGDALEAVLPHRPTQSSVSAAMRSYRIYLEEEADADEWTMAFTVRAQLMLHRPTPVKGAKGAALEEWLDQAVDGFLAFEKATWKLPNGTPYLRKPFHRHWVREILRTIVTSAQLLILSPPRHGKTELLQHFVVWLICRDPNIRIIWVGPNGDIARETTGAVKEMLSDADLVQKVLGPARSFAPRTRAGSQWTDARFTVANRPAVGMKAPTVTAQGKGAKLVSKDADLIIGDDLEDFETTESPTQRQATRRWFTTQLDSRKEWLTGWVMIGSRQHPDDLWGYLIDNPTWASIVETAHDPSCTADTEDFDAHESCMLFPEKNPYAWLHGKWISARANGVEHLYEMVYLNDPHPEGAVFWTRDLIRGSWDPASGIGLDELARTKDSTLHLVAGLDPAATGYQAAFLWGVELIWGTQPYMLCHMLALDNHLGGGGDAFLNGPGRQWLTRYGLRHWVIEWNLYRAVFMENERLVNWIQTEGITVETIDTQGQNKWDPLYGVGAMKHMWDATPMQVALPTGTPEARIQTEIYTTQLLRYTDNKETLKRTKTDVLMASWFPMRTIRRWLNELVAAASNRDDHSEWSYASYEMSNFDESSY